MRAHLLFTFVALASSTVAFGQMGRGPKDFLGIPWKTDPKTASATILAQPGVKYWKVDAKKNKHLYQGGNFGGLPVADWHLYYASEKFAMALVVFQGGGKSGYARLKEQLIAKYGRPTTEKSSRDETESVWTFPPDQIVPDQTGINLELHGETIRIWYKNMTLWRGTAGASSGDL